MIPRNRMDETKQDTDIPCPICNVSICDKCRKILSYMAAVFLSFKYRSCKRATYLILGFQ